MCVGKSGFGFSIMMSLCLFLHHLKDVWIWSIGAAMERRYSRQYQVLIGIWEGLQENGVGGSRFVMDSVRCSGAVQERRGGSSQVCR